MREWFIGIILLVGCLADEAQANSVSTDQKCQIASIDSQQKPEVRDATELVGIHACWDANDSNSSYRNLNDLYARWTIERVEMGPNDDRPRDYSKEKRSAIVRLIIGRDLSFVSSLRIDMHDPNLTFTIPLISFGYEGRVGKGEAWLTDVVNDDQSGKYFRVGPNSSATIAVIAKSSREMDVRAASSILSALRSISGLVSPGGALLTTLNRDSSSRAAEEVDQALKNVWSESIGEQQITGRSLDEWYEKASFLIQVHVPAAFHFKGENATAPDEHERWYRLRLSCPRYSIFYAKPACGNKETGMDSDENKTSNLPFGPETDNKIGFRIYSFLQAVGPIFYRVSQEQVMNFPLAQNKTLQSLLSDQPWYTKFLRMDEKGSPAKSDSAAPQSQSPSPSPSSSQPVGTTVAPPLIADLPEEDDARNLKRVRQAEDYAGVCHAVVDLLYATGLSAFDSRLGLWAMITGSSDFVGIRSRFQGNADCINLLPGGPSGPWQYTTRSTTPSASGLDKEFIVRPAGRRKS